MTISRFLKTTNYHITKMSGCIQRDQWFIATIPTSTIQDYWLIWLISSFISLTITKKVAIANVELNYRDLDCISRTTNYRDQWTNRDLSRPALWSANLQSIRFNYNIRLKFNVAYAWNSKFGGTFVRITQFANIHFKISETIRRRIEIDASWFHFGHNLVVIRSVIVIRWTHFVSSNYFCYLNNTDCINRFPGFWSHAGH